MVNQITLAPQRADVIRRGRHAAKAELLRNLAQRRNDTAPKLADLDKVEDLLLSGRESFHRLLGMTARIPNRLVLSTRESPVIVPFPAKSRPIPAVKKSEAALAIRPKRLHAYAAFSPARDLLFLPCHGSKT